MALGAQAGDVQRLVFEQGGWPVAAGVAAGLIGSVPLSRLLRSLLFGAGYPVAAYRLRSYERGRSDSRNRLTGLMYYDDLGNMAAQVMPSRARAKYAGTQPTPDEAKEAITGYLAYFGTYTVNVRAQTITHHRKGNINPGQVGDDAVRGYEFAPGDRVILTPVGSGNQITWERMK
jgi:hypothetical protein